MGNPFPEILEEKIMKYAFVRQRHRNKEAEVELAPADVTSLLANASKYIGEEGEDDENAQ